MSLIPFFFDDLRSYRPSRLLDQRFGVDLGSDDLFSPVTYPSESRMFLRSPSSYYRPWRSLSSNADSGSTVTMDENKFQVNLDVQQFAPNEITVKATGNNSITVEAKHEEKQDEHGFISRHFVRKYVIPKGHNVDKITSTLSSDGVLTITAPKVDALKGEEREIPITQTGIPSKNVERKITTTSESEA